MRRVSEGLSIEFAQLLKTTSKHMEMQRRIATGESIDDDVDESAAATGKTEEDELGNIELPDDGEEK